MFGRQFRRVVLLGGLWLPLAVVASPRAEWGSRTLHVANNGVDGATCGSREQPCRSISRAIDNAGAGDRIRVGPGRYGDLNSDGDFSDPGEEAAEVGFGCRCMLEVDKRLRIESTDGAALTVLDAGGAGLDVVNIAADDVVFGGYRRGFTLTGARTTGDDDGVGLQVLPVRGVRVTGNTALSNQGAGFVVQGSGHTLMSNVSSNNGQGFLTATTQEGHRFFGNVAISNGNEQGFGHGFSFRGSGYQVVANRAIGNDGVGFLLSFSDGSSIVFRRNEAIGNRGAGIWVERGPNLELHRNDIFGNLGEAIGRFFPALPNCGLVNDSGGTVDATRNYWGAPTGPGPDPADDAGPASICDRSGMTLVEPFETRQGLLEAGQEADGASARHWKGRER